MNIPSVARRYFPILDGGAKYNGRVDGGITS
jgi:hypothetical protein